MNKIQGDKISEILESRRKIKIDIILYGHYNYKYNLYVKER